MYNFTRETIDLEAIQARIARMSDTELVKYGQSAAWMAEHNDRATWRVAARGGQGGGGAGGMPRKKPCSVEAEKAKPPGDEPGVRAKKDVREVCCNGKPDGVNQQP